MAAISLCVIDRNNQPLYIREFIDDAQNTNLTSEEQLFGLPVAKDGDGSSIGGFQCSVRHQFILHAALDRFEQLAGPPPGYGWRKTEDVSGMDAMFVGLLCPVEEMRVYGYVTNTKVKFFLMVEDEAFPELQKNFDAEVKELLAKIHELYVEDLLNPFKDIESVIVSKRFNENVQKLIEAFNESEGMI